MQFILSKFDKNIIKKKLITLYWELIHIKSTDKIDYLEINEFLKNFFKSSNSLKYCFEISHLGAGINKKGIQLRKQFLFN
jgi:hypothetical protein